MFSEFFSKFQNSLEQQAATVSAGSSVATTTTSAPTSAAHSVTPQDPGVATPTFFSSPPPAFHHLSPREFASTFFIPQLQSSPVGVVTTPHASEKPSGGCVITEAKGKVPLSNGNPPLTQLAGLTPKNGNSLAQKPKYGCFTSLENTLASMATSHAPLLSQQVPVGQATSIVPTPRRVDANAFNPNSLLVNTAASNGSFSLFPSTSSPPFQPLPCYPVPTVMATPSSQGVRVGGGHGGIVRSLAPKVAAILSRAVEGNSPSTQADDSTTPPKKARLDSSNDPTTES